MYLERKLQDALAGRYEIGILDNSQEDILAGRPLKINLVKHSYKDRWFADPFVLDVDDTAIEILVEEYYYPEAKGRIAKLRIDRNSLRIIDNKTVLTLETHLSFPLIRRENDSVFVIPENGQSGKLVKYKYDKDSEQLIPDTDLIDKPLADAVDINIGEDRYLFCTVCPDHSGSKLSIYKEHNGVYEPSQTFDFNGNNIARMAGDFFICNNQLYRPCQDCNDRYGYGFLIQEVSMANGRFNFKTLSRYTSPLKRWNLGLHTLNSYKGVMVTDVLGYTIHPSLTKACGYTLGAISRIKKVWHVK